MASLNLRRNGEVKRQIKREKEDQKEDREYLTKAARSSFENLSYHIEIKHKLECDSLIMWPIMYQEEHEGHPGVTAGKITLISKAYQADNIFRDWDLKWNFHIESGAHSRTGTDWRTRKYISLLETDNLDLITDYNEFDKIFRGKFPELSKIPITKLVDYLVLQGEDPLTNQPILIEMGKLPVIKFPIWYKAYRIFAPERIFDNKDIVRDSA